MKKEKEKFTEKDILKQMIMANFTGEFHNFLEIEVQIDKVSKESQRELLPYKQFYDHIKAHFEKEHPEWEVMCKICNKTFKEITTHNTNYAKNNNGNGEK